MWPFRKKSLDERIEILRADIAMRESLIGNGGSFPFSFVNQLMCNQRKLAALIYEQEHPNND